MIARYFVATLLFLVGSALIIIGFLDRRDGFAIAGAILLAAVYLGDKDADDGKPVTESVS